MYEVDIRTHFSAAHRLAGYAGDCARPHGHNWEVEVRIRGSDLDEIGMLVDFREVKKRVADALAELDHSDLTAIPAFAGENPTSENIARYLHGRLSKTLRGDRYALHRVTVRETMNTGVTYWEEPPARPSTGGKRSGRKAGKAR